MVMREVGLGGQTDRQTLAGLEALEGGSVCLGIPPFLSCMERCWEGGTRALLRPTEGRLLPPGQNDRM